MLTDEQLDEYLAETKRVDMLQPYGVELVTTLVADYRRLRAENERLGRLETAVRAILYHVDSDAGRERHWYIRERQPQERLDAIGRLLEEGR